MNMFTKQVATILALGVLAMPAFAAQETFDLAWNGASFSNSATATGKITIDTDSINASNNDIFFPSSQVTGLSVTIAGAKAGNGTFGLSDFQFMAVYAPSALDFSKQLVGQSLTDGSTWGEGDFGSGGDFNLFSNNAVAPEGTWYFTLTTANGAGDSMLLTSMTPAVSAVPEAQSVSMMLAGLGLVGFAARRRKLGA